MDKTSQKVKKDKDPKHVDGRCKGRENFMKKMKENILNDAKKGGEDTTNSSNETTSVTNTATIRSNDTYVYCVGILAVFAIGVCVFFAYNSFPRNKKPFNEKQDQQPKRLPMLQKKSL